MRARCDGLLRIVSSGIAAGRDWNGSGLLHDGPSALMLGQQACCEQFQSHTRRNGTGHSAQRGVYGIGHYRKCGKAERLGLTMQLVQILALGGVG